MRIIGIMRVRTDRFILILASEIADPGSTGSRPDWEFELPENPRETDE